MVFFQRQSATQLDCFGMPCNITTNAISPLFCNYSPLALAFYFLTKKNIFGYVGASAEKFWNFITLYSLNVSSFGYSSGTIIDSTKISVTISLSTQNNLGTSCKLRTQRRSKTVTEKQFTSS